MTVIQGQQKLNKLESLNKRALLVRLRISAWDGWKFDRQATDAYNDERKAAKDTARINKHLLPGATGAELKEVQSKIRDLRDNIHRKLTSPWDDQGTGILATAGYFDYGQKINAAKQAIDAAVDTFIYTFPDRRDEAIKISNGVLSVDDYPDAKSLKGRFQVKVIPMPIPSSGHIAVDITAGELSRIRYEAEQAISEQLDAANKDTWLRILTSVKHMAERLDKYGEAIVNEDGTTSKRTHSFHASMIDNMRELVGTLPGRNITGDQELQDISDLIKDHLCRYDAKLLKNNIDVRAETLGRAQSILDMIYGKIN